MKKNSWPKANFFRLETKKFSLGRSEGYCKYVFAKFLAFGRNPRKVGNIPQPNALNKKIAQNKYLFVSTIYQLQINPNHGYITFIRKQLLIKSCENKIISSHGQGATISLARVVFEPIDTTHAPYFPLLGIARSIFFFFLRKV